jgi:hypothetical protein
MGEAGNDIPILGILEQVSVVRWYKLQFFVGLLEI